MLTLLALSFILFLGSKCDKCNPVIKGGKEEGVFPLWDSAVGWLKAQPSRAQVGGNFQMRYTVLFFSILKSFLFFSS